MYYGSTLVAFTEVTAWIDHVLYNYLSWCIGYQFLNSIGSTNVLILGASDYSSSRKNTC